MHMPILLHCSTDWKPNIFSDVEYFVLGYYETYTRYVIKT